MRKALCEDWETAGVKCGGRGGEDSRSCELACSVLSGRPCYGRAGSAAGDAQIPSVDVGAEELGDEERRSLLPSGSIPVLFLGSMASSAG